MHYSVEWECSSAMLHHHHYPNNERILWCLLFSLGHLPNKWKYNQIENATGFNDFDWNDINFFTDNTNNLLKTGFANVMATAALSK